jgi:hypothetical protein
MLRSSHASLYVPILSLETPQADLTVVKGDLVYYKSAGSSANIGERIVPADTVSACAIAATVSPAASGVGKAPFVACGMSSATTEGLAMLQSAQCRLQRCYLSTNVG